MIYITDKKFDDHDKHGKNVAVGHGISEVKVFEAGNYRNL